MWPLSKQKLASDVEGNDCPGDEHSYRMCAWSGAGISESYGRDFVL